MIMTGSYLGLKQLKQRWRRSFFVSMLMLIGLAFAPADCHAQAVPSGNQSQLMTRPIVHPPVSPLQSEIQQTKQEVQMNTRALARQKNIVALEQLLSECQRDLANLPERYRKAQEADCASIKSAIETEKRKSMDANTRAMARQRNINALQQRLEQCRRDVANLPERYRRAQEADCAAIDAAIRRKGGSR
jgi:hypothetical protein